MSALPPSAARFVIETSCSPAAAQAAVESAAAGMELDVERPSQELGEPWVFRRGPRLNDGPVYYRVDVSALAERNDAAVIRVFALPASLAFSDTQETFSKPGMLAMHIVAACVTRGTR